MSSNAVTAVRDWAALFASVATILFMTLYPHGPSGNGAGTGTVVAETRDDRTTIGGSRSVTAALVDEATAADAGSPATLAR